VFNGRNTPGVMSFTAENLQTGFAYQFKVRALNFNGAGHFSDPATYYSCLSPQMISPPQYISSTEQSMTVKWASPRLLHGCPLVSYELFMNSGDGSEPTTLVQSFDPHVN
jgi:hypothetical protein